ncbi:MAG TPA: VOC family protein [Acidimicrobiales bacterium]|jgi:PhnB protein|nr:VOC family protein [Acidimicrobiales bacterium]
MAVQPIPTGYNTVIPYLIAEGAGKLIDFLVQGFGARELNRMSMPDGSVGHAELQLGDSMIMVGDAGGEWPPTRASLHLYVADVDAVYQAALAAGGTSKAEPELQFYGDRRAMVVDPAGNDWSIATHVEDVSEEEMERRLAAQQS